MIKVQDAFGIKYWMTTKMAPAPQQSSSTVFRKPSNPPSSKLVFIVEDTNSGTSGEFDFKTGALHCSDLSLEVRRRALKDLSTFRASYKKYYDEETKG